MVTLAVFEILSQISTVVICIYRVLRGNEIFETTNITKLTKVFEKARIEFYKLHLNGKH